MRRESIILFLLLALAPSLALGASYSREEVRYESKGDEATVTARLFIPESDEPVPALVLMHGCSGLGIAGSLRPHYWQWVRHLTGQGYAVILPDSLGARSMPSSCGRRDLRRKLLFAGPFDAYGALSVLQRDPRIDPARIALIGWSQGGTATLLSISDRSVGRPTPAPESDFAAAITFYPGACNERLLSEPFTKVPRGQWTPVAPLLILFGAKDDWTPAGPCQRFARGVSARGEPVSFHLYPNAVHAFDAPNLRLHRRNHPILRHGKGPLIGTNEDARKDALKRVVNFLARHLKK